MKLLETMRVSADGDVYLLERHLERLSSSAVHFSFNCDPQKVRQTILDAVADHEKPARLRLTLSPTGECELEFESLDARQLPRSLHLASTRVDSSNPLLYHKTTDRRIYQDADALLVNERGEVTEIAIANIAVLRGAEWFTPPVSCGLLPGIMRAELLTSKDIVEGVILAAGLVSGETIRCFNSVRGVFEASLLL